MADPEIPETAIHAATTEIHRVLTASEPTELDEMRELARRVLAAALPHLDEDRKRKARERAMRMAPDQAKTPVINHQPPPEPVVRYVPVPVYRPPGGGWRRA